jgi:hypothetical protein
MRNFFGRRRSRRGRTRRGGIPGGSMNQAIGALALVVLVLILLRLLGLL